MNDRRGSGTDPVLDRLREVCLGLPEAIEAMAWGAPTFRVKTIFAMYSAVEHGESGGRASVWIKAEATNQELLVRADPSRYFVPPYVGPRGWVGVYLDVDFSDWDALKELLWDGWRMSVPKKLLKLWDEPPPGW